VELEAASEVTEVELEAASEVTEVELEAALVVVMVVVAVVSLVALDPQDLLPAMDLQEEVDLTKRESVIQTIAATDECIPSLQSTWSLVKQRIH
jgi:hypothetical protein